MSYQCYIVNEAYSDKSIFLGEKSKLQEAKEFVESIFSDFEYIENNDLTSHFYTMNLEIQIVNQDANSLAAMAILPGSTQKVFWVVN